jgi:hypothetical protein
MLSFIDYINNVMIKSLIYYASHMHIAKHIMAIIPELFHIFTENMFVLLLYIKFFQKIILKKTIDDSDF